MKNIDLLYLLDQEESVEDAELIEEIAGSKTESFDDHQQWMIDSFKEILR